MPDAEGAPLSHSPDCSGGGFGAGRWERFARRVDLRNGTFLRKLITSMGAIELEVSRAREGGSAGAAVLGRYRRRRGRRGPIPLQVDRQCCYGGTCEYGGMNPLGLLFPFP